MPDDPVWVRVMGNISQACILVLHIAHIVVLQNFFSLLHARFEMYVLNNQVGSTFDK